MRPLPALLCLAVLAAGCFGAAPSKTASPTTGVAVPPASAWPPGCDGDRTAVAHHANGRPAAAAYAIVPCANGVGTGSFEPSIGITASGAVFFYPAAPLSLPQTVSSARSKDQGKTWELLTPKVGNVPTHPYSQDPFLYVDPATSRIFAEDLLLVPPTCGMMSISSDDGATWQTTQSGCATADHVSIFSGPAKSTPLLGYPDMVYRCAIQGGALAGASTMVACQRSNDGGLTWLPPGSSPWVYAPGAAGGIGPSEGPVQACSGGNGHGVVAADGTVYLPRGNCGQPELAVSTDEALTWRVARVSDLGNACGGGLNVCEHDAGLAVDPDGTVYYAWVTGQRWLMLSHSTDQGRTWSAPLNITAPGLNEAALVQMTAGGVGKLALAYLGTRNSPRGDFTGDYKDTTWDGYMAVIPDAMADDPVIYTGQVSPPGDPLVRGECGPVRCGAEFDFIDVRIAPDGTPWAPFVDGCLHACKDSASDGSLGLAARLWNGPSLWDATDPNGPYP